MMGMDQNEPWPCLASDVDAVEFADIAGRRVWFYRPRLDWRIWRLFGFGGDEIGRRTVTIGAPLTGVVVIPVSRPHAMCDAATCV